MIDMKRVSEILQYRKWTVEHNVDAPEEWWNELPKMFSKDIDEAMKYFEKCNEEDLDILTEQFEDIAAESQSKKFIEFIQKLQIKYPNIDMGQDIQWAKQAIED
ncbi:MULTISPECIES: hypothetical protein [Clostridium]|uniref:hypothetical protein n=1 Tax=Clostridium TaxID=1485 RepID=UPI000772EC79|nr:MULTISPECIES: hypothetical protein [Clostridium]AUM96156.1 hypothetical protein RSJ11_13750 [Clostridium sporogenes]AVQ53608.1 hypothetical protein C7M59_12365 [Clostridium botulinum]